MKSKTNKTKDSKPVTKKTQEKIYFVGEDDGFSDDFTRYTESELKEELKNNNFNESYTVYEVISYKLMEIFEQPQGIRNRKD